MGKHDSILETVGGTPAVRLARMAPPHVDLYVKVEAANPMGSVKDRLALGLIEHAERTGALKPGQTVVEATSGNTGIGLAMVCARKGYPLVVVMAENFSLERRRLMRFLGARVVLTPAPLRGNGMLRKARELADEHGWFLCRQFENEANADVHSATTAREILDDFADTGLDYWVTGFGTGGTLKGVARVLKKESEGTRVVVCEPENSRILASGVPQPRAEDGSPSDSHPDFRTHPVQGWAPDFIPKLTEDARELIDDLLPVSGDEAMRLSRDLARKEGIFTGISGGATLAGALKIAEAAAPGSTILCMLPDTGERYLSTPLFDEIPVEMTAEELEISRSTPGSRFDAPSAPPAEEPVEGASEEGAIEADESVHEAVSDPDQPVVMFAYEWCEFCWTIHKLFGGLGIDYRTVDLDSQEMLAGDRGGKIRAALRRRTGSRTMPQVFVAGEYLGGCTELIEAYHSGALVERLTRSGITVSAGVEADAGSLLPAWLHSR